MYDEPLWLDRYADLPELLIRALDAGPHPTYRLAFERLAEGLGVDDRHFGREGLRLMRAFLDALGQRLMSGRPDVTDLYESMTRSVVDAMLGGEDEDAEVRALMRQLGLSRLYVPKGVTWDGVPKAALHEVYEFLLPKVQRMMRRWEGQDCYEFVRPARRPPAA